MLGVLMRDRTAISFHLFILSSPKKNDSCSSQYNISIRSSKNAFPFVFFSLLVIHSTYGILSSFVLLTFYFLFFLHAHEWLGSCTLCNHVLLMVARAKKRGKSILYK